MQRRVAVTADRIRHADPALNVPTSVDDTLVSLLTVHMISWESLHDRYGPLLALVRTLVGVGPNCDRYLEIWPPAFRTYNIMVPNFLNLPFSIFGVGGLPADVVGMGMYVASRTAECPYCCSAHSCSFALRRGASPEKMAQALVGGSAPFTPGELATIAVARSLARVPCELTASERTALTRTFGPKQAEWIVLGVVMMGYLNKFMNAIGVELEPATVAEVSTTLGADWSAGTAGRALDPTLRRVPPPAADTLGTKLRIVPQLPTALRLDQGWQRGVPSRWSAVGTFLRDRRRRCGLPERQMPARPAVTRRRALRCGSPGRRPPALLRSTPPLSRPVGRVASPLLRSWSSWRGSLCCRCCTASPATSTSSSTDTSDASSNSGPTAAYRHRLPPPTRRTSTARVRERRRS